MANWRRLCVVSGFVAFESCWACTVQAEDPLVPTAHSAIVQLQGQIDRQQDDLDKTARQLNRQQKALQRTRDQLEKLRGGTDISNAPAETNPVGKPPKPAKSERPPEVANLFEQPGVLTPKGQWVVEPSLQYAYSTSNQVTLVGYTIIPAITIGVIDIREVSSTTTVFALTSRYGITNRLEVELKVPGVYREDQTVTRPFNQGSNVDTAYNASGHGIGDVEASLRYQFNQGGEGHPFFVGSLRFKSKTGKGPFDVSYAPGSTAGSGMLPEELPTGSGFYGVQPGLNVIFPSDPAVFFGGIDYLWNFKRDINRDIAGQHIGEVTPGNVLDFNLGMGLGLNERASFSVGYQHSVVQKTLIDGSAPPGAITNQLGTLLLGWSYRYAPSQSLNMTLGVGVTRDTPDIQLTLRQPFMF